MKSILKTKILTLLFLTTLYTIGISKTFPSNFSNNFSVHKTDTISSEVEFIEYNNPYDFVYADGVYNDDKAINKYEPSNYNYDYFDWNEFSLDFDFFTSETREQWPIIMGTSTRSLGFLLKDNRTIEITANNQREIYFTKGIYETNRWYHAKIIKKEGKTEIYLNDIKIGDFQIYFKEDIKNYYQKCISSINSSNGIAFDGLLRNIIYTKKGDLEFSKKIYEKYASKYSNENLILSHDENVFQKKRAYNIYSLNWKSFKVQFDYIRNNDQTQLIIGDKWKVIDFHITNDNAAISINNNRTTFISPLKLELNQKYKIEIIINNDVLQMLIDDKIVLNTQFEYYKKNILEREKEILVISKSESLSTTFKNLTIENNVPLKPIEKPCLLITTQNKLIDTKNEGVLEALFIPPFEFNVKESDLNFEFLFKKMLTGFYANSFEIDFEFLTTKKEEQNLFTIGVYTKNAEVDLSIVNNNLVLKLNNKKLVIPPIKTNNVLENWNTCKIVSDKGFLSIYLNNVKTHQIKFKFSDQFYKTKLIMINNTFVGSFRNLYVYESAK